MRIAMVGLGRMGANMVRRLRRAGIEVVGYNRSGDVAEALAAECGMIAADSLADACGKLPAPRIVWLMLPAGDATDQHVEQLGALLTEGDIVIDGSNSHYRDSQLRALALGDFGIRLIDAGTSGGVWGLENGYCLMVGGDADAVRAVEPVFHALAPSAGRGYAHVGPVGAGHFAKMIHNGIEYGMMQAYAEGLALLRGKQEFGFDLAQVSGLWRHGSVVRSWLLDLLAERLKDGADFDDVTPFVADSGEGRWTAIEAVEQRVPAPVITTALQMRFASQTGGDYSHRLLAVLRNAFGGHQVGKS